MSCCSSPTRVWLFIVLFLWLILACARQVFDLIGKLWIPVIFNLLQILSCINGLFAAGQQRLSLLLTLTFTSLISIAYNVTLILWYSGVLGDRNKPLLSAGLPYSHSFFLRYTPSCQSHFNLTTSHWVQHSCIVPYYNIEGFQALIHIIIAIITMLLSLLLFCHRRSHNEKKKLTGDYVSSSNSSSKKEMPNLHNAIYGEAENTKANTRDIPLPPDSINDVSSGYMNSSYEAIGGDGGFKTKSPNSKKDKRGSNPHSRNTQRPKSQAIESASDYSSVTTKSLTNSSIDTSSRPPPPNPNTFKKKTLVNRSVSPIRRFSDEGFSEEDEVARQYSKMRSKSHERRPPNLAEQRLSQAAMEQLRKDASRQSISRSTVPPKVELQKEDSGEYLEYIRAERKPSILNKTSLISFDPKSSTLIRVHEHFYEDDDDEATGSGGSTAMSPNNGYKELENCGIKMRAKRTTSQDSVPSIQAPILSTSHSHLDSGHPSSTSAEQSVSPDWSQIGIAHVTQRPTTSPPPPPPVVVKDKMDKIIGYDSSISYQFPSPPIPTTSPPKTTAFGAGIPLSYHQKQKSLQDSTVGISLSSAIPLLNSLPPQPTSSSSTRFLAQPLPLPDYSTPGEPASNPYYSPNDYGLKLIATKSQENVNYSGSTQFDSKKSNTPATAPIILNNTGLLV